MRYLGLVKWFNHEKGFGIIGTPEVGDVFLHQSYLDHRPPEKFKGTALIFETQEERGKTTAKEITIPSDYNDFSFILSYIPKHHIVAIEDTITGKSRWGNPYKRKEYRPYNAIKITLLQLFEGRSLTEVISYFKQYFDNNYSRTDKDDFLEFLPLLKDTVFKLGFDNSNPELQELISYFLHNVKHSVLFQVWKVNHHKASHLVFENSLDEEIQESSFEFSESIFIENYSLLESGDLQRISSMPNGSQIVSALLFKRIEDLNSIKQQEIIQIFQLLEYVKEEEISNNVKQGLSDKLLQIIITLDFSAKEDEAIESLRFVIEKAKSSLGKPYDEMLISEIYKNVNDEIIYLLWQKYRYFEPDTDFFQRNYSKIESRDLQRISSMPNGSQIVSALLFKRIEDLNSINQQEINQLFKSLEYIKEKELSNNVKQGLSDKLLQITITLDYSDKVDEAIEGLRFVIDKIKSSLGKPHYEKVISEINKHLNDEIVFLLWQKTRYFEPDTAFFQRNYSRLTYDDFINGTEKFHHATFQDSLDELDEIKDIKTFGLLICAIVETPVKEINKLLEQLPFAYQVSLWLNFPRTESYMGKYYEADYGSPDIQLDDNKIIDFFNQLESIDEIHSSWQLVKGIQNKYFEKTQRYEQSSGFRNLDLKMRNQLVEEVLFETDDDVPGFFTEAFNRINEDYALSLISSIIPNLLGGESIPLDKLTELFQQAEISETTRKDLFDYISQSTTKSNRVRLWFDGHSANIALEEIIEEFNSFSKDEQPKLFRKMFAIANSRKINREAFLEQLLNLLTLININLDVQLCLKVIESLKAKGHYIGENVISEIICSWVDEDIKEIIQISDLFEKCEGRTWMTVGENQRSWYLTIEGKDFPVSDNSVIIGDNYYSFDKENKSLVIDGTSYRFRWSKKEHNIFAKLYERPAGVTFCDAVKSEYEEKLKRHFYWCCNGKCYAPRQNDHIHLEWNNYSLRDFINILNLPFEEDKYYRFLSVVNRANRLLKKLQCKSCGNLLRDSRTSEFAFYRVTTFHCTNQECDEFHEIIYLNHCLNWRCLNVVDSRISKKCPNGWYICDSCSNCCSQEKIERRYEHLLTNNAFNPNNPRHQKLKHQVDNKLGHLERGEFFNYKTGENGKAEEQVLGTYTTGEDLPF